VYVAKHNGIVNFANMQNPTDLAKMTPYQQLSADLASGQVPNLSYIVADECNDMHGAPTWCVDSGKPGDVDDNWLVARGDQFVGQAVNAITSSPMWQAGTNAIVVTFDEGNVATSKIVTVVITNHGPRGVKDNTSYNWAVGYYADAGFAQRTLVQHWDGTAWSVIPSPDPGAVQNILYGVAALSDSDVWAVGADQDANRVWHTLAEHWDGTSWTVVPTPDPGSSGNQFYALTAVSSSSVYATGQQSGAAFPSQALIEHWNGRSWSALTPPADPAESLDPFGVTGTDAALTVAGARESDAAPFTTLVAAGNPQQLNLLTTPNASSGEQDLFGAATAPDGSAWAAGWYINPASGNHGTLVEHGAGGQWSLAASPDPGTGDNGLAAITAIPGGGLWAVGVTAASGAFSTLIEHHC